MIDAIVSRICQNTETGKKIFAHTGESSEQRSNYISKRAVPKQITNKSKSILPKTSSKKSSFAVIIGLLIVTICAGIFLQKYKKV